MYIRLSALLGGVIGWYGMFCIALEVIGQGKALLGEPGFRETGASWEFWLP